MATVSPTGDAPATDPGAEEPVILEALPELVDRESVPRFLDPFGYAANSSAEWGNFPIPELSLEVRGHDKVGGHVYYNIACAFARPGQWHSPYYKWVAARRLGHLREGLHDPVKQELRGDYKKLFDGVHFAHKVAVKGTTGRLDTWCKKLASCLNAKSAPPMVAAFVLRILLPEDFDSDEVARAAASASTPKPASDEAKADGAEADPRNPFAMETAHEQGSPQRAGVGAGASLSETPAKSEYTDAGQCEGSETDDEGDRAEGDIPEGSEEPEDVAENDASSPAAAGAGTSPASAKATSSLAATAGSPAAASQSLPAMDSASPPIFSGEDDSKGDDEGAVDKAVAEVAGAVGSPKAQGDASADAVSAKASDEQLAGAAADPIEEADNI